MSETDESKTIDIKEEAIALAAENKDAESGVTTVVHGDKVEIENHVEHVEIAQEVEEEQPTHQQVKNTPSGSSVS